MTRHSVSTHFMQLLAQQFRQNDSIVMGGITRCEQKRDRPGVAQGEQLIETIGISGQFLAIGRDEGGPARRIMVKLLAQLCAGRDILEPEIDAGFGAREAARPQPIDQDPLAVGRFGRIIGVFDHDVLRCIHGVGR